MKKESIKKIYSIQNEFLTADFNKTKLLKESRPKEKKNEQQLKTISYPKRVYNYRFKERNIFNKKKIILVTI